MWASVYPLNRNSRRGRNVIKRMFGMLKNWRRIATRYDCLAVNFVAAIALVATITQWLGRVCYLAVHTGHQLDGSDGGSGMLS